MIGEICHIEAANPEGERYNPTQSDKERASFENLIIFCANHHKKTNNVSIYTVESLKEMKKKHELKFSNRQFSISKDQFKNVLSSIDQRLSEIAKNTVEKPNVSQHQINPIISLSIKPNDNRVQIIDLIIENVGNTVAKNIHFVINPLGFASLSGQPLDQLYFFQRGIQILHPAQNKQSL